MIEQLSQQTIAEYASDALTTQKPEGTDYSQGVRVGRTIPAKWWNWLFNAVTKRLIQSNADAQDMLTEMQNTVTDAGLTLDGTNNTQLSQAVDIKADARIDEFVDVKRNATIKMWSSNTPKNSFKFYAKGNKGPVTRLGNIQTGIYTSGYNLARSKYITEVNGVYFAIGNTASGTLTESGLIFSVDLINWFAATEFKGRESTSVQNNEYLQFGVLYFRGYWYIITVSVYRATVQDQYNYTVTVKRSADLTKWDTVYTDTYVYALSSYNRVLMFVFDDTLYFSDCSGNMYKTVDGTTYSATGATGIDYGWFWATLEPTVISDNCCIINNYLFDKSTDSMTTILAAGFNTQRRGIAIKLSGNKGAVGFPSDYVAYGVSTFGGQMFIVDDSGNVTQLTGVDTYGIRAAVDDVLIKYSQADQLWQFSYDGTNFTNLAYDGTDYLWPVCKIDNTIICLAGTTKLYSIEGNLSDTLADYTLVNASLPSYVSSIVSSQFSCQMFYSAYDNALIVPGAVSYDRGATWAQGTVTTTQYVYNYAGPAQGKDRYGRRIGFCGRTSSTTDPDDLQVAETHPCINRVFGQTLYLQ